MPGFSVVYNGEEPPMNRVSFLEFSDFHSFPVRIIHEIPVHSRVYILYILLIDLDITQIVDYHRNPTIRTLHKSSSNESQYTTV